MRSRTGNMVNAAVFAALIALFTLFFRIPLPMENGYCNLGDGLVLLSGLLAPGWAAAACGVGGALADLIGGFAVYAPATALIKGLMGWMAAKTLKIEQPLLRRLATMLLIEAVMMAGYFLYEALLYGPTAALTSLPGNGCQAAAGIALAAALQKPFDQYAKVMLK